VVVLPIEEGPAIHTVLVIEILQTVLSFEATGPAVFGKVVQKGGRQPFAPAPVLSDELEPNEVTLGRLQNFPGRRPHTATAAFGFFGDIHKALIARLEFSKNVRHERR
jgi:hypothetical protein